MAGIERKRFVPNNLSRDSSQWGREIEQRIQDLEITTERGDQNGLVANKGQNSSINVLNDQVQDLASATAQASAAAAAASVAVAKQVLPGAGSSAASNFSVSTGYAAFATLNFIVPTGYTRAVIMAASSLAIATGTTGGDRVYGKIDITGNPGSEATFVISANNAMGSIAPNNSANMIGLTAGTTVTVQLLGRLAVGPNNSLFQPYNSALLSVTILWLV